MSKDLLAKRRDRAIATILGYKDDYCNEYLPEDVAEGLRKEILDQLNDFYDLCLDVLGSQSTGPVLNVEYMERFTRAVEDLNRKL